tara:strand:- start:1590 stop:2192 length:603 start_codon:yes stop_codon:yes gene_type:complete
MGGIGSGRYSYGSAYNTTDNCCSIDVRRWRRDGLLDGDQSFSWNWSRRGQTIASIWVRTEPSRVTLTYQYCIDQENWRDQSYPIYLDWTPCHLSGQRPWFLCPADGCGRRAAILYAGRIFSCRHCCHLAYPSQRETADDRAGRRADKIRDKLGWEPGFLNGDGWKPKGMHWQTYERLTAEHDAYVEEAMTGIERRLGINL